MTTKRKELATAKPLEEWDDEELERAQLRNSKGTFVGKPPKHSYEVRAIVAEMRRRTILWLDANQMTTLKKLEGRIRELVEGPELSDKDTIRLYEIVTNRVQGLPVAAHVIKAQHEVEITEAPAWKKAVDDFVDSMGPEDLESSLKLMRARNIIGRD